MPKERNLFGRTHKGACFHQGASSTEGHASAKEKDAVNAPSIGVLVVLVLVLSTTEEQLFINCMGTQ